MEYEEELEDPPILAEDPSAMDIAEYIQRIDEYVNNGTITSGEVEYLYGVAAGEITEQTNLDLEKVSETLSESSEHLTGFNISDHSSEDQSTVVDIVQFEYIQDPSNKASVAQSG